MNNTVTILGCGSALPTRINYPSSQLLELRDKQFLIDCGEGCQIRENQPFESYLYFTFAW